MIMTHLTPMERDVVDPLSYFSIQPVLHNWCNKGHGMCYPDWDGAYKRTLAANQKEYPLCWQWVSSLTIWWSFTDF